MSVWILGTLTLLHGASSRYCLPTAAQEQEAGPDRELCLGSMLTEPGLGVHLCPPCLRRPSLTLIDITFFAIPGAPTPWAAF